MQVWFQYTVVCLRYLHNKMNNHINELCFSEFLHAVWDFRNLTAFRMLTAVAIQNEPWSRNDDRHCLYHLHIKTCSSIRALLSSAVTLIQFPLPVRLSAQTCAIEVTYLGRGLRSPAHGTFNGWHGQVGVWKSWLYRYLACVYFFFVWGLVTGTEKSCLAEGVVSGQQ